MDIPVSLPKGVFVARKKDGSIYYRSSLTYRKKHISLGSYYSAEEAAKCYETASDVLNSSVEINDYPSDCILSFDKWVSLINFRDNKIYFKTPIYIHQKYFYYYLSLSEILKFSSDDLFFYAHHTIQKRGGHLFVSDYGMQLNIANRYGIRNFAVKNEDFLFLNGDTYDFRYENIQIINRYQGVKRIERNGYYLYKAYIHIIGNHLLGTYKTEDEAAIAYNKAIDLLEKTSYRKNYTFNYLDTLSSQEYAELYTQCKLSKKFLNYIKNLE